MFPLFPVPPLTLALSRRERAYSESAFPWLVQVRWKKNHRWDTARWQPEKRHPWSRTTEVHADR